jgi:hypothetical protein
LEYELDRALRLTAVGMRDREIGNEGLHLFILAQAFEESEGTITKNPMAY